MVSEHPVRSATMMRAIVQDMYGDADVLTHDRIVRPEAGPDEVLVRVTAAGLDRGTWHMMTGKPYLMRLSGLGLRRPADRVPGRDLAGTVAAVGSAVSKWVVGDEVFGFGRGALAEYAIAQQGKLAGKPANVSFEQAAVVPLCGATALRAVTDHGKVRAGQRVLIIGASGGVGTFAVQLAKSAGAEVTGVASTTKLDLVRSLGADRMIDYTQNDFSNNPDRYDLILDIGGNAPVSRLRRALTDSGMAVLVGGEEGGRLTGGMNRTMSAMAISPFIRQRFAMFITGERGDDLERLATLIRADDLTPTVERSYPLAQAPAAIRDLAAGRVRGKVAITI